MAYLQVILTIPINPLTDSIRCYSICDGGTLEAAPTTTYDSLRDGILVPCGHGHCDIRWPITAFGCSFQKSLHIYEPSIKFMENKSVINCEMCDNSGVRYVANGPDDFFAEFCSCAHGKELERNKNWALGGWRKLKVHERPTAFEAVGEQSRAIQNGLGI